MTASLVTLRLETIVQETGRGIGAVPVERCGLRAGEIVSDNDLIGRHDSGIAGNAARKGVKRWRKPPC